MPFKGIVRDLVEQTAGANGAILADWEGEAVVQHCHYDEFDLKVIGAHGGILLNLIKDVHKDPLHEVVVTTDRLCMIAGVVGRDYSLIMTLSRDCILGRALYHFRQALARLEKEIY